MVKVLHRGFGSSLKISRLADPFVQCFPATICAVIVSLYFHNSNNNNTNFNNNYKLSF